MTDFEEQVQLAKEMGARLEGFADCESLIVAMLSSMAERETELREAAIARSEACATLEGTATYERIAAKHFNRASVLREACLAVSVGQHRTDAYDDEAVAKAHQEAAKSHWRRKGGKASAKGLTPEQLEERARNAANARWARESRNEHAVSYRDPSSADPRGV